jgi:hypothetical protein
MHRHHLGAHLPPPLPLPAIGANTSEENIAFI